MSYPLSADDLAEIAKLVKRANVVLIDKKTAESKLNAGRGFTGPITVPVYRPDGDDLIGKLVEEEGWIGFEFTSEEDTLV